MQPVEQLYLKQFFQDSYLLANGSRSDMQLCSRFAKTIVSGRGNKRIEGIKW